MSGKRREIPVTPPERKLQWCYYSPSIFLASSHPTPPPKYYFDTHPRWQPVTQSARSRQSYGKIGDCEQSIITPFPTVQSNHFSPFVIQSVNRNQLQFSQWIACHARPSAWCSYFYWICLMESCTLHAVKGVSKVRSDCKFYFEKSI